MQKSTFEQFQTDNPNHFIQVADTPLNWRAIDRFATDHAYTEIRFYRVKLVGKVVDLESSLDFAVRRLERLEREVQSHGTDH